MAYKNIRIQKYTFCDVCGKKDTRVVYLTGKSIFFDFRICEDCAQIIALRSADTNHCECGDDHSSGGDTCKLCGKKEFPAVLIK